MSISLRGMHPQIRIYAEYAHRIAEANGITPVVTSVRRTWAEQKRLHDRWKAGKSRWPANPPGYSSHEWGLAWDSWVPEEHVQDWINIRRWVGFHVPENDHIHAALPNWRAAVGLQ